MKHGEGVMKTSDGSYYEGSFICDKRSGEGSIEFSNGNNFVGHWKNDERHRLVDQRVVRVLYLFRL